MQIFYDITDFYQVILKIPESKWKSNQHRRLQISLHDMCCLLPIDKKDVSENILFQGNGGGGQQAVGENLFAADDANSDVFKHTWIVGHTEMHIRDVHRLILECFKQKWAQVASFKSSGKCGSGANIYLLKMCSNITTLHEFTALSCVDTLPLEYYLLGKKIEASSLTKINVTAIMTSTTRVRKENQTDCWSTVMEFLIPVTPTRRISL